MQSPTNERQNLEKWIENKSYTFCIKVTFGAIWRKLIMGMTDVARCWPPRLVCLLQTMRAEMHFEATGRTKNVLVRTVSWRETRNESRNKVEESILPSQLQRVSRFTAGSPTLVLAQPPRRWKYSDLRRHSGNTTAKFSMTKRQVAKESMGTEIVMSFSLAHLSGQKLFIDIYRINQYVNILPWQYLWES